jgi:NADH-quinone oxidoreductase subunit D
LARSSPNRTDLKDLDTEEMVLNMGPQHPSTHGVLRLELVTDGELVIDVIPHLGYMHRCFEKHGENLPYEQNIPFVDRLDYLAAMNCEMAYVMGVEQLLGIREEIPRRVEYIRVLMAELNRIASHLLAIGTYGIDLGAVTAFLWCLRDREHILNLFEWASGARLLYNYMWVGGLYYDLPLGFEEQCREFLNYFEPRLKDLERLLAENSIFIERTANVGALPLDTAVNYGCTGPMLRASGLAYDLRRVDGYCVYPELEFEVPIGEGAMGTTGDCWDRFWVRMREMQESVKIARQCVDRLLGEAKRTPTFDPREMCPKKARPKEEEVYFRAENPRGVLGFYMIGQPKKDVPFRCKARSPSFSNLSAMPEISRGVLIADLVAIIGSVDIVLCEIDR